MAIILCENMEESDSEVYRLLPLQKVLGSRTQHLAATRSQGTASYKGAQTTSFSKNLRVGS